MNARLFLIGAFGLALAVVVVGTYLAFGLGMALIVAGAFALGLVVR